MLSILIGGISGYYWEFVANTSYGGEKTLVQSVFVKIGIIKYHVHHWLLYAVILGFIVFWAYENQKMGHPAIVFIISFIGAALIYGFSRLNGWIIFLE